MTLPLSQLQSLLGSSLRDWWLPPGISHRPVVCSTVVAGCHELEGCGPGEAVIVDAADAHVMVDMVASLGARGVVAVLAAADRAPRGRWEEMARGSTMAVGLFRPDLDPSDLANRINRALGEGRTEALNTTLHGPDTLQELAETLGRLLGNSVTIETLRNELLAFSPMEGPVDRVREETVLRRRGQSAALAWVTNQGYFDEIRRSDDPVWIPANPDLDFTGRLAIRVAIEGEVLAIIWATDTARPLFEPDTRTMRQGAEAAAAILAQQRESIQKEAELRTEFLEDVVQGRVAPESALALARGLGWNIDRPQQALVIAVDRLEDLRLSHASQSGWLPQARRRLTELVRLETLALDSQAVVAPRNSGVIVLFSCGADDEQRDTLAHRLANNIVRRVPAVIPEMTVTVGVGRHIQSARDLSETVREAEMAAFLGESLWGGNRVNDAGDLGVHRALLLLQSHDEMIVPALRRVVEHDERHHSDYVRTLEAYFACMGRLRLAAERLDIHRNTLEYRMHRIEELAGVDLTDPNHRLALELGIRLLHIRQGARQPVA